ncbi:MAG: hypothetical protein ABI769_13050 [Pseudomonadota bacterium]
MIDDQKNREGSKMRMTSRTRGLACALILGCAASMPSRANFTCSGPISYMGLSYNGSINVSVGFGIWGICNLNSPLASGGIGIEPSTCRGWYASILASKKAGEQITLYFTSNANTANGAECSALGSWVVPNPLPYFLEVP